MEGGVILNINFFKYCFLMLVFLGLIWMYKYQIVEKIYSI